MNYAELVSAVQDYTANTDATFVANIPNFVRAGEIRIYNAVELPAKSFYDFAQVTPYNRFLEMPIGFLDVQQLARLPVGGAGAQEFLLQKEVTFIRECWPDPADYGPPKVYGVVDPTTLMLGPTPDTNYTVEMQYTKFPDSIVDVGETWLGENQPSTLLYAALVEAYTFMKGDEDMLKQYASLLADGVAALKDYADIDVQTNFYRMSKKQGAVA
jgi:hypothetical protein